MIPKTIHYCWFSGEKMPRSIQRCIDSWRTIMPDYELRLWDANSFDLNSLDFTREAISVRQWAFAADYVRLFALYTEGGIYLDSDVLVLKRFDDFLDDRFFCGTEAYLANGGVHYRPEAAIIGAEAGHPFVRQCMDYYERRHYIQPDGKWDRENNVMPDVISQYATPLGYEHKDARQELTDAITIYPTSVFTNTLVPNTSSDAVYAIHQNAASWIDYSGRGRLFHFCRKHDMMNLYHALERIIKPEK